MPRSAKPMSHAPSLINPDLHGLWSTSKLGQDTTFWSKLAGSLVMIIFAYSWILGFIFPFFILFLFRIEYYTIAITISSFIMLPYILPISPQPWICRLYVKYGAHYFNGGCSYSFEGEPAIRDSNQPMCAAAHPHGLLCISYFLTGIRPRAIEDIKDIKTREEIVGRISDSDDLMQRMPNTGLAQGYLSKAPIFNFLVTKITGCVSSASRQNVKHIMTNKESFLVLPGGFDEASTFRNGENMIFIRKRKGFIKYCLQFGYEIVPIYFFGECETYNNLFYNDNKWINCIKSWLSDKKIPTAFPIGPYWLLPLLPFDNIGLHSIFSKNTRCDKIDNPTQEQIDEVHEWYMNEMEALFERNKWRFGYDENVKLKIL